jgi:hypothetical protein
MESQERRTAQRVRLHAAVTVKFDEQLFAADTDLRDISLDGMNISISKPLPINRICDLEIVISGPSSVLQLKARGRILRQDSLSAAVRFTELDIDCYMHLKNIVLHNRSPENV